MGLITETRSKLMKIDEVILDVHFALVNEDFEDLLYTQQMVQKVWNDATPKFKGSFMRALVRALYRLQLEDKKNLNGVFEHTLKEQIPVFQPVNQ